MQTSHRSLRIASLALGLALVCGTAARADYIDLWANKTDVPAEKAPPRGNSKLLVIPVQIDYSNASVTYQPVDLTQLTNFFTPAAVDQVHFTFPGYLKVASNNRYTADITIAPLVHYVGCPPTLTAIDASKCTLPSGSIAALTQSVPFVKDVFDRTSNSGVDFSQFDVNGAFGTADGTIDGVMIVVNIPGINLAFPISTANSAPFIYNGIKIPTVAIGGAVTIGGTQHLETIITQQFGSELGLTSLWYDHVDGVDHYPNWQGLHFSSMGDWDFGGQNFLPDPESRRALAWQDQHVVSGTETLTLQPAANGGYAVKLGMMGNGRMEYFLAEARGPMGGYDTQIMDSTGAPTWGLAVYHVDWSVGPKPDEGAFVSRLVSCLDCTPWHPFIGNVESSGQFGLVINGAKDLSATASTGEADDKILFVTGSPTLQSIPNAGVLADGNRYTATNWYDGTESGIAITNVVVNADHTVTATFTAPTFTNPCADVTCPPLMQCATTGLTAGSCVDLTEPVADGGPILQDAGTVDTPPGDNSGCATSASHTGAAMLWLLPLALLLAFSARRKARA